MISARLWLYLLGAGAIIGAGWYLHHAIYESGRVDERAVWKQRFAAAERARDAANRDALQKEADSIRLTQTAEAEHAKTVASLNLRATDADQRIRALSLRLATTSSCRGQVPAVPGASAQPDDTTESDRRATEAGGRIAAVGADCEADAATLGDLQRWVTQQRAIMNR